jgi:hypothetical protein
MLLRHLYIVAAVGVTSALIKGQNDDKEQKRFVK